MQCVVAFCRMIEAVYACFSEQNEIFQLEDLLKVKPDEMVFREGVAL